MTGGVPTAALNAPAGPPADGPVSPAALGRPGPVPPLTDAGFARTGPASTVGPADHGPTLEPPAALPARAPAGGSTPPLGWPADPVSRRVCSLIFNGLSRALTKEQWIPLSERTRVAGAIYDELVAAGIEVRLSGGER